MVALSTTEAELISLCGAAKEGIWLSNLLGEIGIQLVPFTINEDNIPCIRIAEEPRSHQRTKHIDIKYMFIRELVQENKIILNYVSSEMQKADILTKPLLLQRQKFERFINLLNFKIEGKR